MRLTLRTLLAYLDDRLSPANARELGNKISKSPFARELADRIREVVRRRRLAAPDRRQKLIDPNLVAEYLDDQLTPELVALIEKEILASDFALAEVAATHQVLGLLKDPVHLDDRLKERLHAMDPHPAGEPGADAPKNSDNTAQEGWSPLVAQPTAVRRSPVVVLTVLLLGWLALTVTDPDVFTRSGSPDETVAQVDQDMPVINEPRPKEREAANDVDSEQAADVDVAGPPAAATDPQVTTTDGVPASPEPGDDGSGGDSTTVATSPDNTDPNPANPAVAAPNGESPKPVESAEPDAPVVQHSFRVDDKLKVLLSRDRDSGKWYFPGIQTLTETAWNEVLSRELIAVSEPFRIQLTPVNTGWTIQLRGSIVARVLRDGTAGLSVLEGRAMMMTDPTSTLPADQPVEVSMEAGGVPVGITLASQQTIVGIDVEAMATPTPVAGLFAEGNPTKVSLYVAEGAIRVRLPDQESSTAAGRGRTVSWTTDGEKLIGIAVSDATQIGVIPDWVYSPDPTPAETELALTVARGLHGKETVAGAASELSSNRNPQIGAYAVSVLSTTRNIEKLVSVLLASEETVRHQAIDGLRRILNQSGDAEAVVAESLATRLPSNYVENALALLRGVTRIAAEDREVSRWLISMLASDHATVRDLAIHNLERLTSERYRFFADGELSQRRDAIDRWERHLKRNDGTVMVPGIP